MNKYVIFDRDGTLIEHVHYLKDSDLVKLKPGAAAGLQLLLLNQFKFGIITNQSIINRNLATEQEVVAVNSKVQDICSDFKVFFDFCHYCPHKPEEKCKCRKPEIELGEKVIGEFKIDVEKSFYIGDQMSDVEFAIRLGLQPILVNQYKTTNFFGNYLSFSDIFEAALYITKTNFI